MSAITLHRTDAARNMHRYYRLDVQPDLFGEWCFVREWGRIGRPEQMRSVPYPIEQEAHAALARQRRVKERRGYFDRSAAHVISLQIIRRERVDVDSLIFRVDGRQRIERDNPALY